MRDILPDLARWWATGDVIGLATVIDVRFSAPRRPGAAMAVLADGEVVGSVSGGCVEAAVFEEAQGVLTSGQPKVLRYGISDDDAAAVGLTCGGEIDLYVERVDRNTWPEFDAVAESIAHERAVAVCTIVAADDGDSPIVGSRLAVWPDRTSGTLGNPRLDDAVTDDARGMLEQGRTGLLRYGPQGERRHDDVLVFTSSFAPRPRLLVFGAIDFAAAVARIGSFLGFHVTVCDARSTFATRKRFPEADEVVVDWPHRYLATVETDERTVICVLTHDPKFDVPTLEIALARPAAYIGAMGSRRTHDDRLARLRAAGVSEEALARLHSPIGLDLGGRTPEETAVSIAAEFVAERWGGSGRPLRETTNPIHDPAPAPVSY